MRTIFFHCDLCRAEIQGEIAVFIFNGTLLNANFDKVPVKKEAHFCKDCAEKIKAAIDEIGKQVVKVEKEANKSNQ